MLRRRQKGNGEASAWQGRYLQGNAGALQKAILNSTNFSSIATDEHGVIQIFNICAELMLGYGANEVLNLVSLVDIVDPDEMSARANALSAESKTLVRPAT